MYNIHILDEAELDIQKGINFYESQSNGLGAYFLDSIFSDIESLCIFGGTHIKVKGYHRLLAKRFPYSIYYKIEKDNVLIYAVLDCRQNPLKTIERLT
ncbi:MAG: type II toxin-antitoxin system RelE/ParE family toxin [Campylobacterales bacterium]